MKRFLLFLCLVLSITSCASFQEFVNPEIDGLPSWVRNPPIRRDRTGFVARGTGKTEEEARQDAIRNFLQEVSGDLGIDAYNLYFRELSTTGRIEALDGTTDRTYYENRITGDGAYFILVTFDSATYESFRTEEQALMKERELRIEEALENANLAYRENRDFASFEYVLEALLISLEGDVSIPEYMPEELLEEAIYYLKPLKLKVRQTANEPSGEIRVIRDKGLLSPSVTAAPIRGTYVMRNTLGKEEVIDVYAVTDSKGYYYFNSTNPYILRNGEITFSLRDSEGKLERIDAIAPEGFTDPLHELLDSKTVSWTYDVRDSAEERGLDVIIVEYDETGNERSEFASIDPFNAYMDECQVGLHSRAGSGEEEEDVYENYINSDSVNETVAIIRIGVAETEKAGDRFVVRVEAHFSIFDNSTGEVVYKDESAQAIGYGYEKETAVTDAFINAGRILASLLLIAL